MNTHEAFTYLLDDVIIRLAASLQSSKQFGHLPWYKRSHYYIVSPPANTKIDTRRIRSRLIVHEAKTFPHFVLDVWSFVFESATNVKLL
jgi:hypothetical protein